MVFTSQVSWADLVVFNALFVTLGMFPHALDNFAYMKAHYHRVASRPNIAKWLELRPKTNS